MANGISYGTEENSLTHSNNNRRQGRINLDIKYLWEKPNNYKTSSEFSIAKDFGVLS